MVHLKQCFLVLFLSKHTLWNYYTIGNVLSDNIPKWFGGDLFELLCFFVRKGFPTIYPRYMKYMRYCQHRQGKE